MSIHPFLQRPHPAISVSWQGRLDGCETCAEVVSVARDFLASFSPYELAVLPEEVRAPAKLHDGEDLTPYAFELVRRNCDKDPPAVADLVHKMGHFFSHASIRLAELQARTAAGHAAEEEERRSA
jgi:hypothetical protein